LGDLKFARAFLSFFPANNRRLARRGIFRGIPGEKLIHRRRRDLNYFARGEWRQPQKTPADIELPPVLGP
jgi:hypothetical protein